MIHYDSATRILEESIKDIAAGYWCKSHLAKYGEGVDDGGNVCDFSPDDVFTETTENWQSFSPYEKPMGCALGLIAMYGGIGEPFKQKVDGVWLEGFCPTYPNDHFGITDSHPVVESLKALYEALPEDRKIVPDYGDFDIDEVESAVYEYNDSDDCDRPTAEAWFRRALDLVNASVKA